MAVYHGERLGANSVHTGVVTGSGLRRSRAGDHRCRTIEIQADPHAITGADPVIHELGQALEAINSPH
jgi:hypothetical protein